MALVYLWLLRTLYTQVQREWETCGLTAWSAESWRGSGSSSFVMGILCSPPKQTDAAEVLGHIFLLVLQRPSPTFPWVTADQSWDETHVTQLCGLFDFEVGMVLEKPAASLAHRLPWMLSAPAKPSASIPMLKLLIYHVDYQPSQTC